MIRFISDRYECDHFGSIFTHNGFHVLEFLLHGVLNHVRCEDLEVPVEIEMLMRSFLWHVPNQILSVVLELSHALDEGFRTLFEVSSGPHKGWFQFLRARPEL